MLRTIEEGAEPTFITQSTNKRENISQTFSYVETFNINNGKKKKYHKKKKHYYENDFDMKKINNPHLK